MSLRPFMHGDRLGGSAAIAMAATLWGTAGAVRAIAPDADPVSVAAARVILGGLLLAVLGTRGPGFRHLMRRGHATWAILILGAASVAVYQTAFFAAITRTGVAAGTVVAIGSAPAFAGLLGWLTGSGRVSGRWIVATAGALIGCGLLVSGGQDSGVEPLGLALALLSGFCYAVYATVASRFITQGEDDGAVIGVLFGGAGLLLVPVLFTTSTAWLLTAQGALVTLYLGAIGTALSYVLYARGLRTTTAASATTLSLAEPAIATVLGLTVLGEDLTPSAVAGVLLVGMSLVLLIVPRHKWPTPRTRRS